MRISVIILCLIINLSTSYAQTCMVSSTNCTATAFQTCLSGTATNISLSGCSIGGGTFSVPNNRIINIALNGGDVQGTWSANAANTTLIANGVTILNKSTSIPNFTTLNVTYGGSLAALISAILPVEMTRFDAKPDGTQIVLSWETAQEQNNGGFEIFWSIDAEDWSRLDFIQPKALNSNQLNAYSFTHRTPDAGTNYYRIIQHDTDGKQMISQIRSVKRGGNNGDIRVFPNPASQYLNLTGIDHSGQGVLVQIINTLGALVSTQQIEEGQQVDLNGLGSGMFRLVITGQTGVYQKAFAIQQ
jgi:Secretion system C-terminal sorting domain